MTNIDPDAPIFEEDWNTDQSVTRKKRSPLERTIVWGFIFIALIVVLIEGNARFGYSQTLAQMQNQMDMSEKDQDDASKRVSLFKEGKPYRRNTDKLK